MEITEIGKVQEMYYELQPLRLQAGWKIELNNFSEYDLDIHGEQDCFELNEDLLQLQNEKTNLLIDLGWYPAHSKDGSYHLMLVKNFDWTNPLENVITRSKKEVVDSIEKWCCKGFWNKYVERGT